MKLLLIGLFIFSSLNAFTKTLEKNGQTYKILSRDVKIASLIKDYSQLNGVNLFLDENVKGTFRVYGPLNFSTKDFETYLSYLMSNSGYSLIRNEKLNQIRVISSRDIRYATVESFESLDSVPNDFNIYKYVFKLKYFEGSNLSRNLRPFMSRYGRVIDLNNDTIVLNDTGRNIHRIADILKMLDVPSFLKDTLELEKVNLNQVKEVKVSKGLLEILGDNKILFVILFFIVGIMFGFTGRGYVMKKIEGGW